MPNYSQKRNSLKQIRYIPTTGERVIWAFAGDLMPHKHRHHCAGEGTGYCTATAPVGVSGEDGEVLRCLVCGDVFTASEVEERRRLLCVGY